MLIKKPALEPLAVPWDELDPGIVDRVRMFSNAAMWPFASCEGHGRRDPWVQVLETNVEKIYEVLIANGESGFSIDVEHSFPYPTENYCYVFSTISWWREDART